jgi:hypothetical protein
VAGWLIWLFAPWPSETLVYPKENFQCSVPGNWIVKKSSPFVVTAHRFMGGTFSVVAQHVHRPFMVNGSAFIHGMRGALESHGNEILGDDTQPFAGHPAYSISFRRTIRGVTIYTYSVNFVANGFRYSIDLTERGQDPMQDTPLVKVLHSFALLPPAP